MANGMLTIENKLSLDDPRWADLNTFFHDGLYLRTRLIEWMAGVEASGTPRFDSEFTDDIFQMVLHQTSVVSSTFAVVPYWCELASRIPVEGAIELWLYIGWTEEARSTHGVYFAFEGQAPEPDWIMPAYRDAIDHTATAVENLRDEIESGEHASLTGVGGCWEALMQVLPALQRNSNLPTHREIPRHVIKKKPR